jgi:hypothetical protein
MPLRSRIGSSDIKNAKAGIAGLKNPALRLNLNAEQDAGLKNPALRLNLNAEQEPG